MKYTGKQVDHAGKKLRSILLKNIDARINERGSAGFILLRIDIPKTTVYSLFFEATAAEQAEMEYVRLEKKYSAESDNVVALVSATAVGGIKEAYPNFFADSSNFLQHLTLVLNI